MGRPGGSPAQCGASRSATRSAISSGRSCPGPCRPPGRRRAPVAHGLQPGETRELIRPKGADEPARGGRPGRRPRSLALAGRSSAPSQPSAVTPVTGSPAGPSSMPAPRRNTLAGGDRSDSGPAGSVDQAHARPRGPPVAAPPTRRADRTSGALRAASSRSSSARRPPGRPGPPASRQSTRASMPDAGGRDARRSRRPWSHGRGRRGAGGRSATTTAAARRSRPPRAAAPHRGGSRGRRRCRGPAPSGAPPGARSPAADRAGSPDPARRAAAPAGRPGHAPGCRPRPTAHPRSRRQGRAGSGPSADWSRTSRRHRSGASSVGVASWKHPRRRRAPTAADACQAARPSTSAAGASGMEPGAGAARAASQRSVGVGRRRAGVRARGCVPARAPRASASTRSPRTRSRTPIGRLASGCARRHGGPQHVRHGRGDDAQALQVRGARGRQPPRLVAAAVASPGRKRPRTTRSSASATISARQRTEGAGGRDGVIGGSASLAVSARSRMRRSASAGSSATVGMVHGRSSGAARRIARGSGGDGGRRDRGTIERRQEQDHGWPRSHGRAPGGRGRCGHRRTAPRGAGAVGSWVRS